LSLPTDQEIGDLKYSGLTLELLDRDQTSLGIGAGGTISQSIEEDTNDPRIWDTGNAKLINIQIINCTAFETITGCVAPPTPVSAQTYASLGLPFYELFREKLSMISGAFGKVKTLSELDMQRDCPLSFYYDVHHPPKCAVCKQNLADCL
jgi:hypothetical protein